MHASTYINFFVPFETVPRDPHDGRPVREICPAGLCTTPGSTMERNEIFSLVRNKEAEQPARDESQSYIFRSQSLLIGQI